MKNKNSKLLIKQLIELQARFIEEDNNTTNISEELSRKIKGGYGGYANSGCTNNTCDNTNSGCNNTSCGDDSSWGGMGGRQNYSCTNSGCST